VAEHHHSPQSAAAQFEEIGLLPVARRLTKSDLREVNMISFQRSSRRCEVEDTSVYDEINVFQTLPWLNFLY
jgi:hypothetical protein